MINPFPSVMPSQCISLARMFFVESSHRFYFAILIWLLFSCVAFLPLNAQETQDIPLIPVSIEQGDLPPVVAQYESTPRRADIYFTHSQLTSWPPSTSERTLIVIPDPSPEYCANHKFDKGALYIRFALGLEDYNYGETQIKKPFEILVHVKAYDIADVEIGHGFECALTLTTLKPEQICRFDVGNIINDVAYFRVTGLSFYNYPTIATDVDGLGLGSNATTLANMLNDVRLHLYYTLDEVLPAFRPNPPVEEDLSNPVRLLVTPIGIDAEDESWLGVLDNPVTLSWDLPEDCMQDEFPSYELQILRLINRDPDLYEESTDETKIKEIIDWRRALSFETGPLRNDNGDQIRQFVLTIAEGRGYYVWRVRPIGNKYGGGIANDRNWGVWSDAPEDGDIVEFSGTDPDGLSINGEPVDNEAVLRAAFFFYAQFDDVDIPERNWSFSRVFTEGEEGIRVHEELSYLTPLLFNRQSQVWMRSENLVLINETIYDHSGRPALRTLTAPMEWSGFNYRSDYAVYSVDDFDGDATLMSPNPMGDGIGGTLPDNFVADKYYTSTNPINTVPLADQYPYSRVRVMPDGRVTEIGGPGQTFRIGGGAEGATRTARILYGKTFESELLAMFGDEAPDASSVHTVYRTDPNKVTNVQYVSKSGQTLATALIKADNPHLNDELSVLEAVYDETSKTLIDAYSIQGSDRLYSTSIAIVAPHEEISLTYKLRPSSIIGCGNICRTCQYKVSLKIYSAEDPSNVHHSEEMELFDRLDLCEDPEVAEIILQTINDNGSAPLHLEKIPAFNDKIGTWIIEFRLITDNIDPADLNERTFAVGGTVNLRQNIADDIRERLLDKIGEDLNSANLINDDPSELGLYNWLEAEATNPSDPDLEIIALDANGDPLDEFASIDEAIAFEVKGTGSIECWAITIPKYDCTEPQSDFDLDDDGVIEVGTNSDDGLDFEQMLPEMWGGVEKYNYRDKEGYLTNRTFSTIGHEYFYYDGDPLAELDGSGIGEIGAFNRLVQNMLNDPDADYTVPELLNAWIPIVENYSVISTIDGSGDPDKIDPDINLIEEFLLQVGKMYHGVSDCPYGTCLNGTGNKKGYIDYAYKFFNVSLDGDNPDPSQVPCVDYVGYTSAWNADPDNRGDEIIDTDSDPNNNKKWELLYQCITASNRKPSVISDIFDNCACDNAVESSACLLALRDKAEEQCRSVCAMRADGFRWEVLRMYHQQNIYMEGESNIPAEATTISPLQVECIVRSMIEECEGNCELTPQYEGTDIVEIGTTTEKESMENVFFGRMKIQNGTEGCSEPWSMLSYSQDATAQGIAWLMNSKLNEYREETEDQYFGKYNSNQLRDYFIELTGITPDGCWNEYGTIYINQPFTPVDPLPRIIATDCCSDNFLPSISPSSDNTPGIFDFSPSIRAQFIVEQNMIGNYTLKLRTWCTRNTIKYMQEAVLCDALEFNACSEPLCFNWKNLEIPDNVPFVMPATCSQMLARRLRSEIDAQVQELIQTRGAEYYTGYRQACLSPNSIDDELEISQPRSLYHFTLYYYDRAGRLVRTVPPAGVDLIPADGSGNRDRNTHPDHTLITTYEYNSLGQLVATESPDGGRSTFVHDDVGRLRLTQDARQAADDVYAYTRYDELSRTVETGQCDQPSYGDEDGDMDTDTEDLKLALIAAANKPLFPEPGDHPEQRVYTRYTKPDATDVPHYSGQYLDGTSQRYTLNRVAHIFTEDGVHTQYSYDPHGNVEWIQQDIPELGPNWARYEYDLISGNVLKLHYNEGWRDGFKHAWSYDKDNRLKEVKTSKDGIIWESDARYYYYPYGPLRRVEYGEDSVQGRDFVYTLHGWLKGINHPALDARSGTPTNDPGRDGERQGPFHPGYASDAFGMILTYYAGDFNRGSSAYNSLPSASSQIKKYQLQPTKNLYNGNITSWTSSSQKTGQTPFQHDGKLTGYVYEYDVLNRLLDADFKLYDNNPSGYAETSTTDQYNEEYTYDPNGNIQTLKRYGPNGLMDNLTYQYYLGEQRNRLRRVYDGVAGSAYNMDIDNQPDASGYTETSTRYTQNDYYQYDEIGNLIKDKQEGTTVEWSIYGKALAVTKAGGDALSFVYDANGNRVAKTSFDPGNEEKMTFYVYDASGKVLAIYKRECQLTIDPSDQDNDGVPNNIDNCPCIANPDQYDQDLLSDPTFPPAPPCYPKSNFAGGNACDFDLDGDATPNGSDNDIDGDGLANFVDPCPTDNRNLPDCNDYDGDGIPDDHDNCPTVFNPLQVDVDHNGIGDDCQCKSRVEWMVYGNGMEGRIALVKPAGISRTGERGDTLDIIPNPPVSFSPTFGKPVTRTLDEKSYELKDHLGNVRVVISDVKIPAPDTIGITAYTAQPGRAPYKNKLHALNNYYAFGMLQPQRSWSSEEHRYGFNGKEMDNDWNNRNGTGDGTGNVYDYGFRIYDPRLGRFMSVDPLAPGYPSWTPYAFAMNRVIDGVDLDGLEYLQKIEGEDSEESYVRITIDPSNRLNENPDLQYWPNMPSTYLHVALDKSTIDSYWWARLTAKLFKPIDPGTSDPRWGADVPYVLIHQNKSGQRKSRTVFSWETDNRKSVKGNQRGSVQRPIISHELLSDIVVESIYARQARPKAETLPLKATAVTIGLFELFHVYCNVVDMIAVSKKVNTIRKHISMAYSSIELVELADHMGLLPDRFATIQLKSDLANWVLDGTMPTCMDGRDCIDFYNMASYITNNAGDIQRRIDPRYKYSLQVNIWGGALIVSSPSGWPHPFQSELDSERSQLSPPGQIQPSATINQ